MICLISESPAKWLEQLLNEKLKAVGENGATDVTWQYVKQCLNLLKELELALKDTPDLDVALSIQQQQKVSSLMQMVIALGLVPFLLPGVGVPIEKRSKFFECVSEEGDSKLPILTRHNRLVETTKAILDIFQFKPLSKVLINKHLGDLLAAMVQLSHAPLKKPSPKIDSGTEDTKSGEFEMTEVLYENLQLEQGIFANKLDALVDDVYQPLVVKSLLLLQTCGASQVKKPLPKSVNAKMSRTPKWVQEACGKLLSRCLVAKNGVLNVIQGVFDVGTNETDNAQKYQVIAGVVSNPPSTGKYSDLEKYFQLVSPQLVGVLDREDTSEGKMYHMVASACIRSLTERSIILSRRYLLSQLFEPLTRLGKDLEDTNETSVMIEEEELSECLRKLHLSFVLCNDPSMTFVTHLQPVILILLDLHCSINFGVSHLKQTVEQIVQRYFRCVSRSLGVATLRAFALSEYKSQRDSKMQFHFQPMLPTYAFVPGESGGIRAIIKQSKKSENGEDVEEEQSFYVADDDKSIVLVDLLQECNDSHLTVELYLSLLRDLTNLISNKDTPDFLIDEKRLENVGDLTTCDQLLQLERDLDDTMLHMRRRLMVIRLLGLMGEDEKLQEELMKNSERLISFLSLTLERCAILARMRHEKKMKAEASGTQNDNNKENDDEEEEDDFAGGVMEMQSLQMALSLLKEFVTSNYVQVDDWKMLLSCAKDLRTVSELHTDPTIRILAGRLDQLICMNGQVLKHKDDMNAKANEIIRKTEEVNQKIDEIKSNKENKKELSGYADALKHLEEDEIPIRGHGLISLTALVDKKDKETMENIGKVFEIFQNNLADPDTYIYLQAIKGLASCSFHKPEIVIDKLTSEFANLDDSKYSGDKAVEIRTKQAEALVRVTQILGEFTPAHKNKLLNPFLSQLNHPDGLVRASSLANLGEVCKNLRFSLGDIVHEVSFCLLFIDFCGNIHCFFSRFSGI